MVLFDNASEVDELTSTLSLLFSPKSLILFGDKFERPIDDMELSKKYGADMNFKQSMFGRLVAAGRNVLNLGNQYRFSDPVAHFLSECFYGKKMPKCRISNHNSIQRFALFHRASDDFVFHFIEQLMNTVPNYYTAGVVLPPNANREILKGLLR